MTAHVPMARVPFAPLDNPRLQHLASAKNRQNGALTSASMNNINAKTNMKSAVTLTSPTNNKRAYEPSTFDEFDSENVDPKMFDLPSKKTKGNENAKPFTFSLSTSSAAAKSTMPPPAMRTPLRSTNLSSPRAPSTAPAGRSPKRKIASMKSTRRISAPFGRVNPPGSLFTSSASALPFSLDAVLNGSLPTPAAPTKSDAGATIAESMPKNWFFEIYEDTPEEEAANLMEHSTLTLDLSSDDDEDAVKKADYRGKENTPPEGYDAPTASRFSSFLSGATTAAASAGVVTTAKKDIVRKKIATDDMDDGARSPLSDLETESFIPEGVDKDDFVVVDEVAVAVVKDVFTTPVEAAVKETTDEVINLPVVDSKGDVKGEIVVWEDEAVA